MERKIGNTHMAFYRGWLQGLPLRQMADTYLVTGLDLRVAKSTLRWIQDTLRKAALRHGRFGEARLLRVRIQGQRFGTSEKPPAAAAPTIDEYREDVDPAGFYTYEQLLETYLDRYPQESASAADNRRARLVERQVEAVNWITSLLVTDPVPDDAVKAWFDSPLCDRFEAQGISTIADLQGHMARTGYHWYKPIKGVGRTTASRVVRWLITYKEPLGALPAHVYTKPARLTLEQKTPKPTTLSFSGPVEPLALDEAPPQSLRESILMVPLEAMLLPVTRQWGVIETIDTENLKSGSEIDASDDRQAVESWLNARASSDHTRHAYRKEAERLVLWACHERGKTLPELNVSDCTSYRDWLCSLGRIADADWHFRIAQKDWFAPRYTRRHTPAWRPFEGQLSGRSVDYALTVCRSLFKWLAQVRYIASDPWPAVGKIRAVAGPAPEIELTRVFSTHVWQFLVDSLDLIENRVKRRRTHLLLRTALVTGMRLSELASLRCSNFYVKPLRSGDGQRWMLKFLGKGNRWRAVPLTDDLIAVLSEDLVDRGMPADPLHASDDAPVFATLDDEAPLTASGIAQSLTVFFKRVGVAAAMQGDDEVAGVLRRASVHWIRHTTGAFLGNNGVPATQIQQLLGHASVATTSIYTSTNEDELYRSVSAVFTTV